MTQFRPLWDTLMKVLYSKDWCFHDAPPTPPWFKPRHRRLENMFTTSINKTQN